MAENLHELTVNDEEKGLRLDKLLSARLSAISRSYLQQLITDGHVTKQDTVITTASHKVKPGEQYRLEIPVIKALALEAVAMPLDIIFEDEHFLVINKPPGLAVHPAPGTYAPTLVHGLLAHCGDSLSGIGGVARPGIVHRIDKDTSGLMVVAKHDAAHQHLSAQLKDRSLSRVYQAVCWGVPNPPYGTIDAPIGRHPGNRKRMAVLKSGGKEARTHYKMERIFRANRGREIIPFASLISCKLDTGRTHQIRVHLSEKGHGLIGDPFYGSDTASRLRKLAIDPAEERDCFLNQYRRQALHACMLTLCHPISEERLTFTAPLADDIQQLLAILDPLHDWQNRPILPFSADLDD